MPKPPPRPHAHSESDVSSTAESSDSVHWTPRHGTAQTSSQGYHESSSAIASHMSDDGHVVFSTPSRSSSECSRNQRASSPLGRPASMSEATFKASHRRNGSALFNRLRAGFSQGSQPRVDDGSQVELNAQAEMPSNHASSGSAAHEQESSPGKVIVKGPDRISWSEGAKLHEIGRCSPCAWNWRASGCCNGDACEFCHMCDRTALKAKRKHRIACIKEQRQATTGNHQRANMFHSLGASAPPPSTASVARLFST